jgi:Xaa-Pro aminopeptidase
MSHRLEGLRRRLKDEGLDAVLISQSENRRYFSGFTGSAGFLLIAQKSTILATDFRYIEQAKAQAPGFEIFHARGEMSDWFMELITSIGVKRVGFEANDISFASYRKLVADISKCEIVPTDGIVGSLRAVKDEGEMAMIQRAVSISDAAFDEVVPTLCPGMTELEVAWEFEKAMREKGSESLPFDIIVASGPNAALPHHRPGDRALREGEPIVIDMGARVHGYCSDLSRTVCLGKEDGRFAKVYDLVLGAQLTAIATIEAGMSGDSADGMARTVIEQGGHGEGFGHGLGHGVGLAPHELPRLGRGSPDVLQDGMVFTVEPGVYISGWGGVRIEDVVVLEQGRVKVLSHASKTR